MTLKQVFLIFFISLIDLEIVDQTCEETALPVKLAYNSTRGYFMQINDQTGIIEKLFNRFSFVLNIIKIG